jgi:hypothetical protein
MDQVDAAESSDHGDGLWRQAYAALAQATTTLEKANATLRPLPNLLRDFVGDQPGRLVVLLKETKLLGPLLNLLADKPKPVPCRWWKLPVTFLSLAVFGAVSVIGLAIILRGQGADVTVPYVGIVMSRKWLAAVLGGVLGGSARALYSFLFENWAFHYRQTTGKSSPCMQRAWRTKDIEDDMDPLVCWHLYLVKPAAGATLGFLFAAAVELGLITLGGGGGQSGADTGADIKAMLRVVVAAGLAGLFMENAMHGLRRYTDQEARGASGSDLA